MNRTVDACRLASVKSAAAARVAAAHALSPSTPSTKDGRRTFSFIAAAPGGSSRAISSVHRPWAAPWSAFTDHPRTMQPRTSRSHNGRHDSRAAVDTILAAGNQTVHPKTSFSAAIRSDPQRPSAAPDPTQSHFFLLSGNSYASLKRAAYQICGFQICASNDQS